MRAGRFSILLAMTTLLVGCGTLFSGRLTGDLSRFGSEHGFLMGRFEITTRIVLVNLENDATEVLNFSKSEKLSVLNLPVGDYAITSIESQTVVGNERREFAWVLPVSFMKEIRVRPSRVVYLVDYVVENDGFFQIGPEVHEIRNDFEKARNEFFQDFSGVENFEIIEFSAE